LLFPFFQVVMSHPQALSQCDNFIRSAGFQRESTYDTAGSAKLIKEGNLRHAAAICSELAAKIYGLQLLESGIEDDKANFTRFLLLEKQPVSPPPTVPSKTSIVFSLTNSTGALFKAIACFALRDIDLTKIESRPGQVGSHFT
jgi:prephenate dehydratase